LKILDLTAGNRAIWFDKNHPRAVYLDKRAEVNPTVVCDTREIPESVGSRFNLVVFDPPHLNTGKNSNMSKCYGHHTTAEILETIEKTAHQAHKISAPHALMAFKWNDHDIRLERVLKLMPQWEPLFGHCTNKDRPRSKTYWVMLRRMSPKKRPRPRLHDYDVIKALKAGGMTIREIARTMEICHATVQRALKNK
jgi:hypothetical protein